MPSWTNCLESRPVAIETTRTDLETDQDKEMTRKLLEPVRLHSKLVRSRNDRTVQDADVSKLLDDLIKVGSLVKVPGFDLLGALAQMVKSRLDLMTQAREKAAALLDHLTTMIDYYKRMAIRFYGDDGTGEKLHQDAINLVLKCNLVLETVGFPARRRDQVKDIVRQFITTYEKHAALDDCTTLLTSFIENMIMTDRCRSRSNVLPFLEGETIGLKGDHYKIAKLIKFLKQGSSKKNISVVYLYGAKGVGKSRVLNELLHRHTEYLDPDGQAIRKIYIVDCSHSGDSSNRGHWPTFWQEKLLEQMVDAVSTEGLACKEVGKQKIMDSLSFMKEDKMELNTEVLLAIDNISEDGLLSDWLPGGLSDCLPPGSCVIVSVEGSHEYNALKSARGVYQDLQHTLQGSNCVYKTHSVNRLPFSLAKQLFFNQCSSAVTTDENTQNDSDTDNLISRCDGLPLLLRCFGKYFGDNKQPPRFWEKVCKELADLENDDACTRKWHEDLLLIEAETQDEAKRERAERDMKELLTMSKLGFLYSRRFSEDLQMVIGDCAKLFNGWCHGTVDSILGRELMTRLKSALEVKQVNSTKKLPPIADVTRLYSPGPWQTTLVFVSTETLWSARKMYENFHIRAIKARLPNMLESLDHAGGSNGSKGAREFRSLSLIESEGEFQMQWIDKLEGLRYILVHHLKHIIGTTMRPLQDLQYLHFGAENSAQKFPFRSEHLQSLKTLSLSDLDFAISKFEVPPQLATLSLLRCTHLSQALPRILGSSTLRTVHIRSCIGVQALTSREENRGIQYLSFQLCDGLDLDNIPQFATKLMNLATLEVLSCKNPPNDTVSRSVPLRDTAQQEPSSCHQTLKHLLINDCHNMVNLPADVTSCKSLVELDLDTCSKLERLPAEIDCFSSMEVLNLSWCVSLETLPPQIGALKALKSLLLVSCSKLRELPNEIGQLLCLEKLKIDYCASLTTLPQDFILLESLTYLSMSWCVGMSTESWQPNLSKLPKRLNYLNLIGLDERLILMCVTDLSMTERGPLKLLRDGPKNVHSRLLINPEEDEIDESANGRLWQSEVVKKTPRKLML